MPKIELQIGHYPFVLKSDENLHHTELVSQLVKKKIENLLKKNPKLDLQKASLLVAFDLASQLIKCSESRKAFKIDMLNRTKHLLELIESKETK